MSKIIGTHNGSFHSDEALAIYMIQLLPEYKSSKIIRTRDPNELEKCDIVVDVGGVYDHATKRYDHHQRSFDEQFSKDFQTRLSSAGLIYKHYGKQVISQVVGDKISQKDIDFLYIKLYKSIIESFDGVDNGVERYPVDIEPKYEDHTSIFSMVKSLNPGWNEPDQDYDQRFSKAMTLVGNFLVDKINYYSLSWLPARDIVLRAYNSRFDIDPSGLIMLLDHFCPWESHLFDIEASNENTNSDSSDVKPLYIIFEDTNGSYRIRAISKKLGSFENRKPLPEQWRGYRDDELSQRAKVKGCIFVHATGFIGGNQTRDGAIEMAKTAIDI
ncbi:UPF0160 protein [Smittium mucronatum]|uniref:UPF0160 protein n=1 Tax=Smittium mucronatum TaxID=133383 RepID=A0A1R0H8B5_9FUNG|nr:UPF0160 protein [Smittium mucronatum]